MELVNPLSMKIDNDFQLIGTLGIGGAGEVYSIRNITNNMVFAAKYARKDLKVTQQKKMALLQHEKDIMEDLHDHPNILKSYQLYKKRKSAVQMKGFETANQEFDLHLLTSPFHLIEYCENGSFISYLKNQEKMPEDVVVFYTEQLLQCIEYVHSKGYAHLDIKLDNILLDPNFNIRLSDFGSAIKVDDQPQWTYRRGTPRYMAPEVNDLKEGESFDAYKADVYSLGVCIYLMLFKRFPVYQWNSYPGTKDLLESSDLSQICYFDCDKASWERLSPEMQKLIIACLNRDPEDRPSMSEIVNYFYLPSLDEFIEDRLFENMQSRRAKFEQLSHDKQFEQQIVNPVQSDSDSNEYRAEEIADFQPKNPPEKSGSSTYASTNSKN